MDNGFLLWNIDPKTVKEKTIETGWYGTKKLFVMKPYHCDGCGKYIGVKQQAHIIQGHLHLSKFWDEYLPQVFCYRCMQERTRSYGSYSTPVIFGGGWTRNY